MNIQDKPTSLSLLGNIKPFVLNSTASVSFLLKKGDTVVVEQTYDPSASGVITIDIKDVIAGYLEYQLSDLTTAYAQPKIVGTFSAVIDGGAPYNFTVVRAGVDKLSDTASNFLTSNWLTWQPQIKAVTYSSPEYLTYYAVVSCKAILKATMQDDSVRTIDLVSMVAGTAYTIPCQYATISAKLGGALPKYYDIYTQDGTGNRLSYIQRYYPSSFLSEQEQWILFENSLGGLDTFRAYGQMDFEGAHTHNIAEIDEIATEYRIDTERKFKKNTGHIDEYDRRWLLDFFPSRGKYIYTGSSLRRIVVTESNVTYVDKELPSSFEFTYKYADSTPYLNLQRTDALPADITISIPEAGSFTVPPRLIDFPRLPITEGALFPVQSPFDEKWGTTTAGALGEFFRQYLAITAGNSGNTGHSHDNMNILNGLSMLEEYLLYRNNKIKAGYADKAGEVAWKCITNVPTTLSEYGITDAAKSDHTHNYLSPDKQATVTELYTFEKGIKLGDVTLVYDKENNALKIDGSAYAVGGIACLGAGPNVAGGGGGVSAFTELLDVAWAKDAPAGSIVTWNGTHFVSSLGTTPALDAEILRATNEDARLLNLINADSIRISAFSTSLAAEIQRATNEENALKNALSAEITRATNADNSFSSALSAEVNRATSIESGLNSTLSTLLSKFNEYFSWDAANQAIKVNYNLYSTGGIAAMGSGPAVSGGSSASLLSDLLDCGITNPSAMQALVYDGQKWRNGRLNASMIDGLKVTTTWGDITNKPNSLAGYGITDAVWTANNFNPATKLDVSAGRILNGGIGIVQGIDGIPQWNNYSLSIMSAGANKATLNFHRPGFSSQNIWHQEAGFLEIDCNFRFNGNLFWHAGNFNPNDQNILINRGDITYGTNFNNLGNSGIYDNLCGNNENNSPHGWSKILNLNNGRYGQQLSFPLNQNVSESVKYRNRNGQSWGQWITLWDSQNSNRTDADWYANYLRAHRSLYCAIDNPGDGKGLSLYGGADPNTYGIHFSLTSNFGKHGDVQGDWANYYCVAGAGNRGHIFRTNGINVASISNSGNATFNSLLIAGDGIWSPLYVGNPKPGKPSIAFNWSGDGVCAIGSRDTSACTNIRMGHAVSGGWGTAPIELYLGETRKVWHTDNFNPNGLEQYTSGRDFPSGTLILTNVAFNNDFAFLLEIKSNTYHNLSPFTMTVQGYIYKEDAATNWRVISQKGTALGYAPTNILALNLDGKLAFWFGSQGYWCGYTAKLINVTGAGYNENRVINIVNSVEPASSYKVNIDIDRGWHSGNANSSAFDWNARNLTAEWVNTKTLVMGSMTMQMGNELNMTNNGDLFIGYRNTAMVRFGVNKAAIDPARGYVFANTFATYTGWTITETDGGLCICKDGAIIAKITTQGLIVNGGVSATN